MFGIGQAGSRKVFQRIFYTAFFLKMEFRTLNSFELLLKNKARNTGILPQEGLSDIL